ncbi:hypothetical protein JCGZ_06769 [Jatropha curcas]|uniref:SAUR family protein n=1 Tax=Jatropha curcas TaxID=180498 RepID=A0A067KYH9_JATCU|nr:auxin-responsive protein SAUR21 [Jatropha curcas]KDP37315.1 hypothetical protein JCGZ_06769 [Jatropha curcas]
MKMLGKKMNSFKKLAKKVKVIGKGGCEESQQKCFSKVICKGGCEESQQKCLLGEFEDASSLTRRTTPTGFFAVYVGEEMERFVVPTGFLSHPLFKMLLEKSQNEFGFGQTDKLVVPCSVSTFQEVVNAVECCNGRFDFGNLVEEFI